MGLYSYNGVTYNSDTGTSTVDQDNWQPTTGTGSNNPNTFNTNDQKWWQSAIEYLPGILMGTAAVVQASKNNQPIYYGNNGAVPAPVQMGMSPLLWLVIGIAGIALLYFAFRKPAKKA